MTEPTEWQNFDQSSLPILLRHDTWTWHIGISLLCGIDPRKSEYFEPCHYYNVPYDEIGMFAAETGTNIENPEYWKIQLLADRPNTAKRVWYKDVDEYQDALHNWAKAHSEFESTPDDVKPYDEFLKTIDELFRNHMYAVSAYGTDLGLV